MAEGGPASSEGEVFILKMLLQYGTLDYKTEFGWTPLMEAASVGNAEFVRQLLEWGARADVVDRNGNSPQSLARKGGHLKVEEVLRQHEAYKAAAEAEKAAAEAEKAVAEAKEAAAEDEKAAAEYEKAAVEADKNAMDLINEEELENKKKKEKKRPAAVRKQENKKRKEKEKKDEKTDESKSNVTIGGCQSRKIPGRRW